MNYSDKWQTELHALKYGHKVTITDAVRLAQEITKDLPNPQRTFANLQAIINDAYRRGEVWRYIEQLKHRPEVLDDRDNPKQYEVCLNFFDTKATPMLREFYADNPKRGEEVIASVRSYFTAELDRVNNR